ncbi:hypothetical protein T484DRAFT_1938579 [Baffinella frigidus]|nr:hypothetical protein T484DRAFT_1938579 [Cryptophyta sp. CCMP2293]
MVQVGGMLQRFPTSTPPSPRRSPRIRNALASARRAAWPAPIKLWDVLEVEAGALRGVTRRGRGYLPVVALVVVAVALAGGAVLSLSLGGQAQGAPGPRWELQAVWAKGIAAVCTAGGQGGPAGPPELLSGVSGKVAGGVVRAGFGGRTGKGEEGGGGGKRRLLMRAVDGVKSMGFVGLAIGVVDLLLFM